jgi:cyclic pyranopterin phosphate synthase
MDEFTHFDKNGNAVMVDVHEKDSTYRIAVAEGKIFVNETVFDAITDHTAAKGDVLGVARIAGIMGAKRNSELIPLCHIISLTDCEISFVLSKEEHSITAICKASCVGKTGVEMEAMTGVSVALLTIYDMCKAMDREMRLSDIRLLEKDGGKSGHFIAKK